jgi:hypothetical protein
MYQRKLDMLSNDWWLILTNENLLSEITFGKINQIKENKIIFKI